MAEESRPFISPDAPEVDAVLSRINLDELRHVLPQDVRAAIAAALQDGVIKPGTPDPTETVDENWRQEGRHDDDRFKDNAL